jgi:Carbon dioxide concentrating mechanism/carboxysome shell protein
MIIAMVIGNVWATKKEDSLNGLKLMVVQRIDPDGNHVEDSFVAVDRVGAGIGERVLIVTGSSARKALRNPDTPVDAAIVGILDEEKGKPGE